MLTNFLINCLRSYNKFARRSSRKTERGREREIHNRKTEQNGHKIYIILFAFFHFGLNQLD